MVLELPAQGDPLAGDHDHAGVRGAVLNGNRLGRRTRDRTDRAAPLQPCRLTGLQRVGSGPQQLTGFGSKNSNGAPSSMYTPTRRPVSTCPARTGRRLWAGRTIVEVKRTVARAGTVSLGNTVVAPGARLLPGRQGLR